MISDLTYCGCIKESTRGFALDLHQQQQRKPLGNKDDANAVRGLVHSWLNKC